MFSKGKAVLKTAASSNGIARNGQEWTGMDRKSKGMAKQRVSAHRNARAMRGLVT